MTNGIGKALASTIVETADLSEGQKDRLDRALVTVAWAGKNCKPVSGAEDGTKAISPAVLAKTPIFRHLISPKNEVDLTLGDLARIGVVSEPQLQPSTGGKRAVLCFLWDKWVPGNAEEIESAVKVNFIVDLNEQGKAEPDPTTGEVEGITPDMLGHLIEPPPPPAPIVVAPYKHPMAPGAPNLLKGHEVRALFDFRFMFDGQCLFFKKGQIIDDPMMAKQSLKDNMPVKPVSQDWDGRQFCPKCHKVYIKPDAPENKRLNLRPSADLMFAFNGTLLRFATTDVITDPILCAWLKTQSGALPCTEVQPGVDFNLCGGCGPYLCTSTKTYS